ncbi:MAG: DUF6259 domain-containing protein [Bacillota bacterium]|nr:DUF6259 domain-containing protein [Bacillota bacterium]
MKSFKDLKFTAPVGGTFNAGNRLTFKVKNNAPDNKEYIFTTEESITTEDYIVMEYTATNLQRFYSLRQPLLMGAADKAERLLLIYNELIIDGMPHRMIVKANNGECVTGLRFRLRTKAPEASLDITKLYTCSESELPKRFEMLLTETFREGLESLSLEGQYNSEFNLEPAQIESGTGFIEGKANLLSIPFEFSKEAKVLRPSAPPEENEDIIKNFTVMAKRRLCRPESRDSSVKVPINREAREIFFVLALSGLMHQRWNHCAPDPTILGSSHGEVMMPLKVNDAERFLVEIEYEDGRVDEAFPVNLYNMRHVIQGETGVYGIYADGSKVKSIIFHDRMLDTDTCIAAVTVNVSGGRILNYPIKEVKKSSQKSFDAGQSISIEQNILTVSSGASKMTFDIKEGLYLTEFKNSYTNKLSAKGAFLKVRMEDGNIIQNFDLKNAKAEKDRAEVSYMWDNVTLNVHIAFGEDGETVMHAEAKNLSGTQKNFGLMFPVLPEVTFDGSRDSWYFFPKLQNIESNETISVYEESAPSFPMQFVDLFSPSQGGGIALTTRERGLKVRKYGIDKYKSGITAFVEYPAMYMKLNPGETFTGSDTSITVHSGSWHKAFNIYKKWLASWYEPYKCQDKMWYRKKFWLTAEITDFFEVKDFWKLPIWYDEEKKEYSFHKIMEEMEKIYGCMPDILHMWGWTYSTKYKHMLWGNFGTTDYDELGGLENFRNAMHEVMEDTGAQMSLYLHPTLLSEVYPAAEKFYPNLRVRRKDGSFIDIKKETYRMCHANEEWRKYAVSMYPRIYKDTGIKLLYVDEFSLRVDNRCWGEGHGHEVPSNLLKTDREFITELKDAMPEEVVLYGEYAAVDVNARYIDCNISYHILDSIAEMIETGYHAGDGDDTYSKVITNMYRFAFPKIVQLILPMAMRNLTWTPLKSTFFNGEAIYDSFWDAEETRGRRFMAKSFMTKKKYADCFASDNPETMIDTPSEAICANKFGTLGKTIYTLYNRAFATYRGDLLVVDHKEGNTYYDAWNESPAEVTITGGKAHIKGSLGVQEIGCIYVQESDDNKFAF